MVTPDCVRPRCMRHPLPPAGPCARAAEPCMPVSAPLVRHPGLSERFALLIVPAAARNSRRSAVAHADEDLYRKRLREIGFDVLTIGPASRPELDQTLRAATARIP